MPVFREQLFGKVQTLQLQPKKDHCWRRWKQENIWGMYFLIWIFFFWKIFGMILWLLVSTKKMFKHFIYFVQIFNFLGMSKLRPLMRLHGQQNQPTKWMKQMKYSTHYPQILRTKVYIFLNYKRWLNLDKVFSFLFNPQKNVRNHYPNLFHFRLKSWYRTFFWGWYQGENNFWDHASLKGQ